MSILSSGQHLEDYRVEEIQKLQKVIASYSPPHYPFWNIHPDRHASEVKLYVAGHSPNPEHLPLESVFSRTMNNALQRWFESERLDDLDVVELAALYLGTLYIEQYLGKDPNEKEHESLERFEEALIGFLRDVERSPSDTDPLELTRFGMFVNSYMRASYMR